MTEIKVGSKIKLKEGREFYAVEIIQIEEEKYIYLTNTDSQNTSEFVILKEKINEKEEISLLDITEEELEKVKEALIKKYQDVYKP